MPQRIHHTLSYDSPWIACVAKGTPLSVRIASGNPVVSEHALEHRLRHDGLGREHTAVRQEIARVVFGDASGKQYWPSPVRNCPLKSAVHSSLGARHQSHHARMHRPSPGAAPLDRPPARE
jgi:hypothetical protein